MNTSSVDIKKIIKKHIEETKNMGEHTASFCFALSGMKHPEYILYIENEFESDMEKLKNYIKESSDEYVWSMGEPIKGINEKNWLKFHRAFLSVAESLGRHYDLGFSIPDPSSFRHSVSGGFKYAFNGLNMYSEMSMDVHDVHMYIFTVEK